VVNRGGPSSRLTVVMTIENGTAIVLAYVLTSIGLIIAFLWAVFVIGWFIGCASGAADHGEKTSG
jgi:hypothetical protein